MPRFNNLQRLFALLASVFAIGLAAAQQDTAPLNPPQPVENDGKIEVLEFFSYACPHCDSLDPQITAWAKRQPADVKFKRVPVDGINGYVGGVGLFVTLDAMGELDRLHSKIFDAFHREHVNIANPATLNKWLEKNGVDVKKFEEVKQSFSVMTRMQRVLNMNQSYKIASVPSIIVNGKVQVLQLTGHDQLLASMDRVIQQERASASGKPAGKK